MAVTDDLNAAIAAITFQDLNNAPVAAVNIAALLACAAQMSAGPPLDELNDAIKQMAWKAQNNAPVGQPLINQLADVNSQLYFGTSTTNPPDIGAIGQLTGAILAQEPGWGPLLWLNFAGTTLAMSVRGIASISMTINAVPWWSNWDTFTDAAADLIPRVYLAQLAGPVAGFDQNYCSPDLTVSADTLAVSRTAMTTPPGARCTALSAFSANTQIYAEVVMHKLHAQDNGVGVANSAQQLIDPNNSWLGAPGNNSLGMYDDGSVWQNGAQIDSILSVAEGDLIGVAIDGGAKTVQLRNVTQNGSWRSYDISALGTAPFRLGITLALIGEGATANFAGPFVGVPPSGFGPWMLATPATMLEVTAPAVISEDWQQWSFGEGRSRACIRLPDGLALTNQNGALQMLDPTTDRVYELPPLPANAAAWWAENWQTVRGGMAPRNGPVPIGNLLYTSTTMQTFSGPLWWYFFETFFGFSRLQQQFNTYLYAWMGTQTTDMGYGVFLLQPVFEYSPALGGWAIFPTYYDNRARASVPVRPATSTQVSAGSAFWGVVWWANGFWRAGFFRGNARNTNANFQSPMTTQLLFRDATGIANGAITGIANSGFMNTANVSIENGGTVGSSDGSTTCPNVSAQAVFGGLNMKQLGGTNPPVQWQPPTNKSTCGVSYAIIPTYQTNNGRGQITLTINPS